MSIKEIKDIKDISGIKFGVLSNKEIEEQSVCEVHNNKLSGDNTVYDIRMGASAENQNCGTCMQTIQMCPGHIGHIKLNEPILHPLFYDSIVNFLRCFCIKCNKLMITEDQIELDGINRYKGHHKFLAIIEKIKKNDVCCNIGCMTKQPKYTYNNNDNNITMVYKPVRPVCICDNEEDCDCDYEQRCKEYSETKKKNMLIVLETDEIIKIFDNVKDEEVLLVGLDPEFVHPRNFIIHNFPVIPPCSRAPVVVEDDFCDDDLTIQITEIVKLNNQLAKVTKLDEIKKQKIIQSLKFRIKTYYNNSDGKAKHPASGRVIKSIKERINGKTGQVRGNMMGKRCEQTARTVIGGDPTVRLGQIILPRKIANTLTFPENVNKINIEKMQKLVDDGRVENVERVFEDGKKINFNMKYTTRDRHIDVKNDDLIIRDGKHITITDTNVMELRKGDKMIRDGKELKELKTKNKFELRVGDRIKRYLCDGDFVIFNRQPTLHKGSMLGKEILIKDGRTIRFSLAATKPFNSDFDITH